MAEPHRGKLGVKTEPDGQKGEKAPTEEETRGVRERGKAWLQDIIGDRNKLSHVDP